MELILKGDDAAGSIDGGALIDAPETLDVTRGTTAHVEVGPA